MINSNNGSIDQHFNEGVLKSFSKGEVIVHGNEVPKGAYQIQSGFVKAYSISPQGQTNLLLIHSIDEIIPLPWSLNGLQTLGIYYEAMSDVTLLRTSRKSLRDAMNDNPALTQQVLSQLVDAFTVYTQRIQSLEYRSPRERVAARMLDLGTRFGEVQKKGVIIKAPITHQDIGDSLNMTRETASRVLEQLFEEKLLSQEEHQFIIKDVQSLQAELD